MKNTRITGKSEKVDLFLQAFVQDAEYYSISLFMLSGLSLSLLSFSSAFTHVKVETICLLLRCLSFNRGSFGKCLYIHIYNSYHILDI